MSLSDVSPLQRSAPEPSAPNRTRLTGGWEAEFAHPSDIRAVDIEEPGGPNVLLALTKERTSGACRLTQPLQLPSSESLEDVVLCYTCRASGPAFLEAGGVLERSARRSRASWRRPVHKIVAEADGTVTLTGVAHLDPASLGSRELFVFFQCSAAAGRLEISDFHVEGFAADWLDALPDRPSGISAADARAAGARAHARPATASIPPPMPSLFAGRFSPPPRRPDSSIGHPTTPCSSRPCRPPATSAFWRRPSAR